MINKTSNINPQFGAVNNTARLQAELSAGSFAAQSKINANLRKAEQGQQAIAEFKKKREEKRLTDNAIDFLNNQSTDNPSMSQALGMFGLDGAGEEEQKIAIKALGGPENFVKALTETAEQIRSEAATAATKAPQFQSPLLTAQEYSTSEPGTYKPVVVPLEGGGSTTMYQQTSVTKPKASAFGAGAGDTEGGIPKELANLGDSREVQMSDGTIMVQTRTGENSIQTEYIDGPGTSGKKAIAEAQAEVDKKFAKDYLEWSQGKQVDAVNAISAYTGVINSLKSGIVDTGTIIDRLPFEGAKDFLRPIFNEEGQEALESIRIVVERSLKEILGGSFSESEGIRMVANAYNPALSEEANIRRLERARLVFRETMKAKDAMAAYYEEYGTLKGYVGPRYMQVYQNQMELFEQFNLQEEGFGENPQPGNIRIEPAD
jgi:hypothetical protein